MSDSSCKSVCQDGGQKREVLEGHLMEKRVPLCVQNHLENFHRWQLYSGATCTLWATPDVTPLFVYPKSAIRKPRAGRSKDYLLGKIEKALCF